MEQAYEDAVAALYDHRTFRGKISLDPIRAVMEALGHPEQDFPAVHVAGTNGKGSTATMLAGALEEAGYRTGLFTSPHLTDFRERVRVDGDRISRRAVVDRYRDVAATDVDTSFFECMTAMAFDHFARADVDIAVVETGMGGRVDATNVVEPACSVITNVAREHTRWLGETPEQIAYELAGIAEADVPLVSGATGPPEDVIAAAARAEGAPLRGVDPRAAPVADDRLALTLDIDGRPVETGLVGRYQVDNVDTALAALDALDRDVPRAAVRDALAGLQVPGRMEPVARSPLVLLDGAHNPEAVQRLPATLADIETGRVTAAASIMADKDCGAMLSTLEDVADRIVLAEADIDRAADPSDLADHVEATDCAVVPDPADALHAAVDTASADDTVLVTGSLYFVGDVKAVLEGAGL
ncbi:MAG: folylpolyglutamate synthase/dihydrofolate synthase family protein [Candidatus Nanohaloarchaea archaeon]|nr:folylpolyglutamate synthase/dihydrofolate synthase family protein [Candidatus Nanohaloarchaea archaeon]